MKKNYEELKWALRKKAFEEIKDTKPHSWCVSCWTVKTEDNGKE